MCLQASLYMTVGLFRAKSSVVREYAIISVIKAPALIKKKRDVPTVARATEGKLQMKLLTFLTPTEILPFLSQTDPFVDFTRPHPRALLQSFSGKSQRHLILEGP